MGVVAAVLVLLNEAFGWDVPSDTVMAFAAIVISYILGESYIDGKSIINGLLRECPLQGTPLFFSVNGQ